MWIAVIFCAALLRISSACEFSPSSPLETAIVCRVTKPAALVLNEQTAQVIQAAFRHATYPDINGEKAVRFLGKVTYGLTNIQISNLSIESSHVELREDDAVNIMIRNVSASFKGTLSYGYGAWFVNVGQTIDFELFSSTDLEVNTKLTCGGKRVAADTSDCYLTFHQLLLHLHGNKQPGWIKQLFTDFISFTLKLVLKSQICKEINHVANLLADFIQDRAENFLNDGDIGVNIDITSFPVIKSNYMESHHKGLLLYKNLTVPYNGSKFSPSLLTDHKMLYFWFSEDVLNALALASFLDHRLELLLPGAELQEILKVDDTESHQEIVQEILEELSTNDSHTKIRSLAPPEIRINPKGTIVKSSVAVQLQSSSDGKPPTNKLYFETDVTVTVQASYADKKLMLHLSDSVVHIRNTTSSLQTSSNKETMRHFLHKTVTLFGIPMIMKRLEPTLTSLMNSKGLALFDIIEPEIIPNEGYLTVQLDFGFPHHLLVDFLKKSL
ncbi:cholesteryl ester transfer protein [Spea bombifrons]|uniref:cholesteryl ester transfer protein n=1 Tax=Spea bombifrons TaxID=233779 RepID=UPI00234A76EC|nr:cholesteryl ester transfer protein [Spea bombifrons]